MILKQPKARSQEPISADPQPSLNDSTQDLLPADIRILDRGYLVALRAHSPYNHAMLTTAAAFLLLFIRSSGPDVIVSPEDSDRDGLADPFEYELMRRFMPRFMLSAKECDDLPAEFQPGLSEPRLLSKNGTIYGQVFPTASKGLTGAWIEIHYYHLWSRDCGKNGHALDSEHVSVLVGAPAISEAAPDWRALYWYAAAHEDTICDASHGARAGVLGAVERGPTIWISNGKHASFLSSKACQGGCGGDSCSDMIVLSPSKLLNIGEPSAPMSGALWAGSKHWQLLSKMKTDFSESVREQLGASKETSIVALHGAPAAVKSMVHAGGESADALSTADQKTGAALSTADAKTGHAASKAASKVGRSLKWAARGILGIRRDPGN